MAETTVLYFDCPKCAPNGPKATAQARLVETGDGSYTLQYLLAACAQCKTKFEIKLVASASQPKP